MAVSLHLPLISFIPYPMSPVNKYRWEAWFTLERSTVHCTRVLELLKQLIVKIQSRHPLQGNVEMYHFCQTAMIVVLGQHEGCSCNDVAWTISQIDHEDDCMREIMTKIVWTVTMLTIISTFNCSDAFENKHFKPQQCLWKKQAHHDNALQPCFWTMQAVMVCQLQMWHVIEMHTKNHEMQSQQENTDLKRDCNNSGQSQWQRLHEVNCKDTCGCLPAKSQVKLW